MPTKYNVNIIPGVEWQLNEIYNYIEQSSLVAAKAFMVEFEEKTKTLSTFPNRAALIPENTRWKTFYRHLVIGKYRVIFRVVGGEVVVLAVWHGSRLLRRLPQ